MSVTRRTWKSGDQTKEAWIVRYATAPGKGNGLRHIKTFQRKADAVAYAAKVTVDVSQGAHVAPSQSPTVAETAERWLADVTARDREQTTLRQYRQHIDLHIAPRLGGFKVAQLNPAMVEKFRDDLRQSLSIPLARKVLTSFKSMLKHAKCSHIAVDVKIGDNKRKLKIEAGRDFPSTNEIKRIIAAAPHGRMRTLLLTAALTGLRASELRGLRWADVDLKARELHVRQRADRYCQIGPPKSTTSVRSIDLDSDTLLPALKAWKLQCPLSDNDLVFPTSTGEIEHHANMLRSIAPVLGAAGIVNKAGEPKYALHAFRHFFASCYLNPVDRGGRGLQPNVVQELLGHGSIGMTMDVYGHLFPRRTDRRELDSAVRSLLG